MKNLTKYLFSGIFILTMTNCVQNKSDTPSNPVTENPDNKKSNGNGGAGESEADRLAREAKEKAAAKALATEFNNHKASIEAIVKISSNLMNAISTATNLADLETAKTNGPWRCTKRKNYCGLSI